jgi:hypothetical protein
VYDCPELTVGLLQELKGCAPDLDELFLKNCAKLAAGLQGDAGAETKSAADCTLIDHLVELYYGLPRLHRLEIDADEHIHALGCAFRACLAVLRSVPDPGVACVQVRQSLRKAGRLPAFVPPAVQAE